MGPHVGGILYRHRLWIGNSMETSNSLVRCGESLTLLSILNLLITSIASIEFPGKMWRKPLLTILNLLITISIIIFSHISLSRLE